MKSSWKQMAGVFILGTLLGGCGGSGSSDTSSGGDAPAATLVDAALSSNGATVTSSYSSGNETFVIDGDKETTNYWSGGKSGDWVRVDFGKTYSIRTIRLFTNNISLSLSGVFPNSCG